jgi:anti-sigma regulatory factor (Ser/Thr protein kinase)
MLFGDETGYMISFGGLTVTSTPSPMSMLGVELRLPARAASAPLLRVSLRLWLTQLGLDEQQVESLVLAGHEGFHDAISRRSPRSASIDVAGLQRNGIVEIVIRDHGWQTESDDDEVALRLSLMHEVVDAVTFDADDRGTTVTLLKAVAAADRIALEGPAAALSSAPRTLVFRPS